MKREPNLFEAFRDVKAQADRAPEPAKQPREPRRGPGLEAGRQRWLLLAALGLLVVFSVGYFFGGGAKEVAAKGAEQEVESPTASWQPAGPARTRPEAGDMGAMPRAGGRGSGAKSSVSDPSALYKPENQYTVLAITYSDVPSLQGRARDIAEFLRQRGLPAFEPISRAGNIEILVGAAETQGALQELTAKLRGTRGPTGRSYDFQSAYVVNIDDHLDRD